MLNRERIRLWIAPISLSLLDHLITLRGQPPEFWHPSGTRRVFEEQVEANYVMSIHPALAIAGEFVWISTFCLLIYFLPRRSAVFTACVVTIGHALGAASWMPGLCPHSYYAMMWIGIFAAIVLSLTLPLPPKLPKPADDPPRVVRRWVLRSVVVLLAATAIYAFGIPHGRSESDGANVQVHRPTTRGVHYGPHAGELTPVRWDSTRPGIGGTTAYVALWNESPEYILWLSPGGAYNRQCILQQRAEFTRATDQGRVEFTGGVGVNIDATFLESSTGRIDRFIIGDTLYDLRKGAVFLLKMQDGNVRIEQVLADLSSLKVDPASIESLAAQHPEIAAYFEP